MNLFSKELNQAKTDHLTGINPEQVKWKEKKPEYWKSVLTPLQYKVTRKAATERSFTGALNSNKEEGTYFCSNCGLDLFSSKHKFDSGTGWPSFFDQVNKENIITKDDHKLWAKRTELICARCDSHLGHVFNDGPAPTKLRYCINSVALGFKKAIKKEQEKQQEKKEESRPVQ